MGDDDDVAAAGDAAMIDEIAALNSEVDQWKMMADEKDRQIQELKEKLKAAEEVCGESAASETRKRRRIEGAVDDWQSERRPNSCGCGKCQVEISWNHAKIATSSVMVAAGICAAAKNRNRLAENEIVIWAQRADVEKEDKVAAIKLFNKCPRILEYLEDYASWQEAAKTVGDEMEMLARPHPEVLSAKYVICMPKMEKAHINNNKDTVVVHMKDAEIEKFFEKYQVDHCRALIMFAWTKLDVIYFNKIRELLQSKPERLEVLIVPLPLQGNISILEEIAELFDNLKFGKLIQVITPLQVVNKRGVSITAVHEGDHKMKDDDFAKYIKALKQALPKTKLLDCIRNPPEIEKENAKNH